MRVDSGQIVAGKYELVRRLARGGMGAVWRARHIELDVEIALKFQRGDMELGERAEERFRREARAAAQLKSPHVVHIYDYGVHQGSGYIAMELLEGEDLGERLSRQRRLPTELAIDILLQAARGVRAAHERGLVHRDIKPSNLFLAHGGEEVVVKVLDFGIAKDQRDSDAETTQSGMVFGSPSYMSPEQARGGAVDQRTDVWSLGAVLYRMLTGQLAFEGANQNDIIVKLCTQQPAPPSRIVSDLKPDWDEFFLRVLARDPAQRPKDIAALRLEIDKVLGVEGVGRTRGSKPDFAVPPSVQTVGRDTETAALVVAREGEAGSRREAGEDRLTAPLGQATEWRDELDRRSEPRTVASLTSSVDTPPSGGRRRLSTWGVVLMLGSALFAAVALFVPGTEQRRPAPAPVALGVTTGGSSPARVPIATGPDKNRSHEEELPQGKSEMVSVASPVLLPQEASHPKNASEGATFAPTSSQPTRAGQTGRSDTRAGSPPRRPASQPRPPALKPSEPSTASQGTVAPAAPRTDPVFGLPLGSP